MYTNIYLCRNYLGRSMHSYAYKTKTSKPQNFWIAPSKKHFSGSNDQNWMPFGNSFHIWSSKAQCEQNAWKHAMLSIVLQHLQSHIGNPCTSVQVNYHYLDLSYKWQMLFYHTQKSIAVQILFNYFNGDQSVIISNKEKVNLAKSYLEIIIGNKKDTFIDLNLF